MRILVSACLLGLTCRYSGDGKAFPPLAELLNREDLSFVPVCPCAPSSWAVCPRPVRPPSGWGSGCSPVTGPM